MEYVRELREAVNSSAPKLLALGEASATRPAPGEAATLEHVMRDYVAHLQHHLRQIFPERPAS